MITPLVKAFVKPLMVAGLVMGVAACDVPGLGGGNKATVSPDRQKQQEALLSVIQ